MIPHRNPPERRYYSFEEYLEFENGAEFKHEYYFGAVRERHGASIQHCQVTMNLSMALWGHFRETDYVALGSDLRLRAVRKECYVYPDLSVVGRSHEMADEDPFSLVDPVLVAEVLEPRAEGHDRGLKFEQYCKIDSLQEILLVSSYSSKIERYARGADGEWLRRCFTGMDAVVPIPALSLEIPLAEIYEGVSLPDQERFIEMIFDTRVN